MSKLSGPVRYTIRCPSFIRLDQYPERACLSGPGVSSPASTPSRQSGENILTFQLNWKKSPDVSVVRSQTGCLVRINSLYGRLTGAEKRVADYIRSDDEVIYRTITQVVRASGASYGSVDRLCKKLGYSGFQPAQRHNPLWKPNLGLFLPAQDPLCAGLH